MYPLPDVSFAAALCFTGALSATLWFTSPQGFSTSEPQSNELASDLRQGYALFAAKIWFKSHGTPFTKHHKSTSPNHSLLLHPLPFPSRSSLRSPVRYDGSSGSPRTSVRFRDWLCFAKNPFQLQKPTPASHIARSPYPYECPYPPDKCPLTASSSSAELDSSAAILRTASSPLLPPAP